VRERIPVRSIADGRTKTFPSGNLNIAQFVLSCPLLFAPKFILMSTSLVSSAFLS
jgi:hypothetical protein